MKATGQMLKERREALKISLAEVSISTKITSRMLQAIESGNMDLLPARTFLRGFVKSYASYLKMDTDQVLKSFNEDMALLEPQPVVTPAAPVAEPPPSAKAEAQELTPKVRDLIPQGISNFKKAGLGIGVVALLAMIVVVYQLVQKYEREGLVETPPPTLSKIEPTKEEPAKESEAPPTDEPELKPELPAEPTEESTAAESKPTETQAAKPVEPKPAEPQAAKPVEPKPAEPQAIKPVEPKPAEAKPSDPKRAETPTAKPVETKPAVVTPPVVPPVVAKPAEPKPVAEVKAPPAAAPAVAPTVATETKPSATQEIIIEALDKVDITFRVNNGQTKKVSLAPDQVHTIKASGIVAIEMSDGGAVNIIHNGRDVGVPGDLGRPKKIQLP